MNLCTAGLIFLNYEGSEMKSNYPIKLIPDQILGFTAIPKWNEASRLQIFIKRI